MVGSKSFLKWCKEEEKVKKIGDFRYKYLEKDGTINCLYNCCYIHTNNFMYMNANILVASYIAIYAQNL